MKIAVINGSPKGQNSITLQSLKYLAKLHPEHEFRELDAGRKTVVLERDFAEAMEILEWCDSIIFSFPVYTFIAPAQLHRFIEMMFEREVKVKGKFATSITTSKHFYDVTAHKYVEENALDLGLKYVKGHSADMDDLTKPAGREELEKFFDYFIWCIENNIHEKKKESPAAYIQAPVTIPERKENAEKGGDVVIITDCTDENSNLYRMIERFREKLPYKTRIFNISEFPFRGGCLGCFNCAVSGKCIYNDNFDTTLRESIQIADAIVYAFDIKYHSFGSRFKMYNDRNFCNGHRTVTVGMPVGYLVSGAYSSEDNVRMIVEGRAEVGRNFLAGVATDESPYSVTDGDTCLAETQSPHGSGAFSSIHCRSAASLPEAGGLSDTSANMTSTDIRIDELAKKLAYALDNKLIVAQNFLGVGGMKIFRDLIYQMRGMMRADHKFYKKGGYYNDFPQKHWKQSLLMYLVGFMLGNEKIKKKIGNNMNEGMLMPYKKVLDDLDKKLEKEN